MAEYVLFPQQMKEWETALIQSGVSSLVLMENAGKNAAQIIAEAQPGKRCVLFCGVGNNGGDGLCIARHLLIKGFVPTVVLLGNLEHMTPDARTNWEAARCLSINLLYGKDALPELPEADFYVDALFGTGLRREIGGVFREAVAYMNGTQKPVYAVDIPSGIDARGRVLGCAVTARQTITFQFLKTSHLLYPGREYAGEVTVVDIGLPVLHTGQFHMERLEAEDITRFLPKRQANTNKGTYGRVAVIAGSLGLTGAGALCARAALKTGCGLLTLGTPQSLVTTYHALLPEATCCPLPELSGKLAAGCAREIEALARGKQAVAIGPGLGNAYGAEEALAALIGRGKLVIDADGLNALAKNMELLEKSNGETVLTPHPGEMARLCGCSVEEVTAAPLEIACAFAKENNVVLLLKGSTTVIAAPDGRVTFNTTGNPGMAKGGSGDVLTGVIAALLARGLSCYDAARLGSLICGLAGDRAKDACGENGMLASDTIAQLGSVLG